jgi:hypothetical protein
MTSVADAVAPGLVALAFGMLDARLLELEGRSSLMPIFFISTSVASLPP